MKLTKHEIILVAAVLSALVAGGIVKRFRAVHPHVTPSKEVLSKK